MSVPYQIERTTAEKALCVALLALLVYRHTRESGAFNSRAALTYRRMQLCQGAARWFGEQAMRAELDYRKAVGS